MDKAEFEAIFEVSGVSGLWKAHLAEVARERRDAVKSNNYRKGEIWEKVGGAIYACVGLVVVAAAIGGIALGIRANQHQGEMEIHDCVTGNTLGCQLAVSRETGEQGRVTERGHMYLALYRQHAGVDLPRLDN